jgi:hypothetical protein
MKRVLLVAALAAFSITLNAQPYGPGSKGARLDAQATPGWAMMTPEERKAHQDRMASMKDVSECRKYMDEHHKRMQERAKAKGENLGPMGADHGCGHMMMSGKK